MVVKFGDIIPDGTLHYVPFNEEEDITTCTRPLPYNVHEKFKGKKVVLFAIPGAFTPTCSEDHVPGFIAAHDTLKSKGVDEIVCLSVNDAFVQNAYAKAFKTGDKVTMVGDGSAIYAEALGLSQDLTSKGMGVRAKRFAIIVDDLVVKYVGVEEEPGVSVSGAEAVLKHLE